MGALVVGRDARHVSIAWNHLDNLLAYPWFVTWIGKAPWFISETSIAASQFGKCTWEAFTIAFRAKFGAQHAMQNVRQQLRDLKYNNADAAAFNCRFPELATTLDLPPSSPYTSGLWLDYHAKLPPSLQQNLDSAVLVTNSVGQTITLDNAIQLVAQFSARGTSHVHSTSEHPVVTARPALKSPCHGEVIAVDGEPRGRSSTGRLRFCRPVQRGLYSTETKEEEETVDPEEEELEEEEEEILTAAEPLQYSQSKAGKAL